MKFSIASMHILLPFVLVGCASSGEAQAPVPVAAVSAAAPAASQPGTWQPSPALQQRAAELIALINGKATPEALFAPEVLANGRSAQLKELASKVRARRGEAIGVNRIEMMKADKSNAGKVFVDFADSLFAVKIRVSEKAPHLIDGLMLD